MKVKIHCFEGEWNQKHASLSVRPLIEVLGQLQSLNEQRLIHSYKFCQSIQRLREELHLDGRALSKQTYQHCFYFAFHGDASGLWSGDNLPMPLTEIADSLCSKASGSIIFIGSCGSRTAKAQLTKLKNNTKAALVIGYGATVDWLISSLFEMLFFSELCQYKLLGSFIKKMRKTSEEGTFSKLKVQLV